MPITYPIDLSGVNPTNLVQNELHSTNESKFKDYNFIVPNFAPFFIDNFKATITLNGVERNLEEDVDFSFALQYITGTRTTGKAMYGAITLHNLSVNGIIKLKYQTIGGDQIADRLTVLTILADKAYNPRTTIWDIITNVPNSFPPVPHYQDYDSFYGQEHLVTALNDIKNAIIQNSSLTADEIRNFLNIINSTNSVSYVKKDGDTMNGFLKLHSNPLDSLHAATKQYVDENSINGLTLSAVLSSYYTSTVTENKLATKVNKSGDTMTGFLNLNADPIDDSHATTKRYTDDKFVELQTRVDMLASSVNTVSDTYVTREYLDNALNEILALLTATK